MHEVQRAIIKKLRYAKEATFSELNTDKIDSNTFSYHLSTLLKQKLITVNKESKTEDQKEAEQKNELKKYQLTEQGQQLLNFLHDETAATRRMPVPVVALVIENKEGKVLLQQRLKEPWHGHWMLVGGKVEFGEALKTAVERELHEETNLSGSTQLLGVASARTFNKEKKLLYHVHLYCYRITNLTGTLTEDIPEGKNRWFDPEAIEPGFMHPVDELFMRRRHKHGWFIEYSEQTNGDTITILNKEELLEIE